MHSVHTGLIFIYFLFFVVYASTSVPDMICNDLSREQAYSHVILLSLGILFYFFTSAEDKDLLTFAMETQLQLQSEQETY